jgi:hypothetical protein
MAREVFVSEGRLVTEDGDLDRLDIDGPILSNHDALYFFGQDFEGTAGYVSSASTDNAPPYWAFDATTVERIKWQWVPPEGWDVWTMRIAWLAPGASDGNVVWRYKHHGLLLGGDPTTALTTVATTAALTAPAGLGSAWRYDNLATNVRVVRGPLGEAPHYISVIDRFASDAADTNSADAAIFMVTVTRQPQG